MVRRLIRHFLRWLRHVLAKFKGAKSRHHVVPKPPLPPARSPQQFINSQETAQPELPKQRQSAVFQEQRQQLPNPAANRAVNPSNFKIQLSNYQYSPSSAVQSLSHQLLHPDEPITPTKNQPKPIPNLEDILLRKKGTDRDKSDNTSSTESDHKLKPSPDRLDLPFKREPINRQEQIKSLISQEHAAKVSRLQDCTSAVQATAPTTQPNTLVKQGVIKLLFKLKKNNHHGYIAPDDGSKDIIFHQKYIGDEIFCQLERGMAVEVTAHVTEGKAYADHIRLL